MKSFQQIADETGSTRSTVQQLAHRTTFNPDASCWETRDHTGRIIASGWYKTDSIANAIKEGRQQ